MQTSTNQYLLSLIVRKGTLYALLMTLLKRHRYIFLVEKYEALSMFKHFKSCVEKEVRGYIKCLRLDRGGEFTSFEFNEFYR